VTEPITGVGVLNTATSPPGAAWLKTIGAPKVAPLSCERHAHVLLSESKQ
jgi:hypothetical protein